MAHIFRSITELIHQHPFGKLIVDIRLIASILETQYYSLCKIRIGRIVHTTTFCFRVVLLRGISFVPLNQLLLQVRCLFSGIVIFISVFCYSSDPNFWNFNIWDPGMSSTTTTTSTPPTTGTVTTRVCVIFSKREVLDYNLTISLFQQRHQMLT